VSAARLKGSVLVAGLLVSALTLVAWTQPWFDVALGADAAGGGSVSVGGEVAAGGLSALALAGLALVGALSIAGPVFRLVLATLEVLIGVAVVLSAVAAVADPVSASAPALTEATAVAGSAALARLADGVSITAWPWITILLGAATIATGAAIAVTSARWPGSGRKYAATRFVAHDDSGSAAGSDSGTDQETDRGAAAGPGTLRGSATSGPDGAATPGNGGVAARRTDRVADWDALSDGSDPTSR
jgi:hypothetical protein